MKIMKKVPSRKFTKAYVYTGLQQLWQPTESVVFLKLQLKSLAIPMDAPEISNKFRLNVFPGTDDSNCST